MRQERAGSRGIASSDAPAAVWWQVQWRCIRRPRRGADIGSNCADSRIPGICNRASNPHRSTCCARCCAAEMLACCGSLTGNWRLSSVQSATFATPRASGKRTPIRRPVLMAFVLWGIAAGFAQIERREALHENRRQNKVEGQVDGYSSYLPVGGPPRTLFAHPDHSRARGT